MHIKDAGKAALCNQETVFTSYYGNSASFIFTKLGVQLPSGEDTRDAEFGACRIKVRLTLPQGTYLDSMRHQVAGGVVKTKGARGMFRARYELQNSQDGRAALPGGDAQGTILEGIHRFAPKNEMTEALLIIDGEKIFDARDKKFMCRHSKKQPVYLDLLLKVAVSGQRRERNESVIISVDSSDVQFDVGAQLGHCSDLE